MNCTKPECQTTAGCVCIKTVSHERYRLPGDALQLALYRLEEAHARIVELQEEIDRWKKLVEYWRGAPDLMLQAKAARSIITKTLREPSDELQATVWQLLALYEDPHEDDTKELLRAIADHLEGVS